MAQPIRHSRYIEHLADLPTLQLLRDQEMVFVEFVSSLSEEVFQFRYAPGKWSVAEVIGHCSDVERIMAYRALSFARGEQSELPPFDEDAYVAAAGFDRLSKEMLLEEFQLVRKSNIHLYQSLTEQAKNRIGRFSGNEKSVEEIFRVIVGHHQHHIEVIKSRYLPICQEGL